jgi:mannose-6-phosphate isomerase-like protein (cupin superfamily)
MTQQHGSARLARLSEIDAIPLAHGIFRPVRRTLGVRSFGVNAYSARSAGDALIEPHDETGSGAGAHEELYLVVAGRATFTVDGEEIDLPPQRFLFVPVGVKRGAVAAEPETTVLVVGGPAGRPLPVSPFEYWYVAEAPYREGDYARAIELASEGFEQWPGHPTIHFQLACYHALAGERDAALDHFEQACTGDPRAKAWAREDHDLDSIRDDPRFNEAVA